MKLFCVDSNTTLGGHKGLFERLEKNDSPSSSHIFIVPDRYTLGVEKEICENVFPNGSFSVNTFSFTRLAVKGLGKEVENCLSKEGTVLLLHRVIEENNDRLVYYKNIRSVSFARELFAAVASLRSGGITPEEIRKKLPSMQGGIAGKLSDIALLYEKYVEALSEKYYDTVTRVELLEEKLDSIPWIAQSHIYILGFNVYSDLQMRLIKKMLKVCPSVSISFCKGMGGSNVFCYPSDQRSALIDWCKEEKIPVFYENKEEYLAEPFYTLHKDMFGFGKPKDDLSAEEKRRVRVFSAQNPYEEVKCACREIRRLVFADGYRYKDVAVACNDEKYLPVLKTVFDRFGIPCFTDEKFSVSRCFVARYVFSCLQAVCSDYALGDVMEVLRSPLSGVSFEQQRLFENYCIKYNVSYSRFFIPFAFGDFEEAEKVRIEFTKLIDKVPKDGETVDAFCDYLLSVARSEEMEKLREKCEGDEKSNALIAYLETEGVESVAEEIKKLCVGRRSSPSDFAELLSSTLEGMSISLLPQYVDCVFIGNTSDSRFSDVRALFVLGANDGNFPVQTSDPVILSCYDSEMMRKSGLPVYPIPAEQNLFEKFAVIDLCSKPERLYVGYSLTGLSGEQLERGEGVNEICKRLFIESTPLSSYYDFTEEEELLYSLSCPENAYYEYVSGKVPEEYRDSVKEYLLSKGFAVESGVADHRCRPTDGYAATDDGYRISVSVLEDYFSCPYRHFLSRVLKVKEREEGKMQANEKGNIIHAVLEDYFKTNAKILRKADMFAPIERSINKVFSRPEYARFFLDPLSAYEMEQLKKECREILKTLTENVRHSLFEPTFFEKHFSKEESLSLTVGGEKYYFSGVIDRADVYNGSVSIIDYKTGSIDEKLQSVYTGKKIQLYIYLKYFLDKGYRPAGVFYLPIKSGYTAGGASPAMKGQMADSLAVFYSLDDRAEEGVKEKKYVSPTVDFSIDVKSKTGSVEFSDKGGNRLEEEKFRAVVEYVFKMTEQALGDIREGDVEKNPLEGSCDYCPYKKICGDVPKRAKPAGVSKETFCKGDENAVE